MAAASVSSFGGLAGQELSSPLDLMMEKLHLQLCEKIRRDDEILWSGGGVSPHSEEEENHVSSENKEGRLDDDSGSNDVRLNFLPDGGGIESFVQSFIVEWLREHVNLDNWETIFQNFDLDDRIWFEQDFLPCPMPPPSPSSVSWETQCADDDVTTEDEEETKGLKSFVQSVIVSFLRVILCFFFPPPRRGRRRGRGRGRLYHPPPPPPPPPPREGAPLRPDQEEEEEEDNHISSEKHKTAETIISHGTDGVESCFHSVIVPFLRECVNLDNRETIIRDFDLKNAVGTYEPFLALLKQIMNSVGIDLSQVLETNPDLSQDDLNVYFLPVCWSSKTRVDFWSDLSDELLSRADKLKELMSELETMWQPHFGEKRNDKIDDELLSSADELKKLMVEWERTWQPLFGEKRKDKMVDELLLRVDELKKLRLELERTWGQHFGEKRNDKIDELLARADKLKELRLELERTWQLHFGEKWNDEIDEEWIKKFGEKDWGPHLGEKWIDKIDEKWIEKNGKKWIDNKIDEKWIEKNGKKWIDKTIEKWIENVDPKYKPRGSDFIFVKGLLRFMRNRRHHLDKFQESHGLRSKKSFYNYFNTLFPCLLMVSYGVADRVCREEPWFKKYRLKGNL